MRNVALAAACLALLAACGEGSEEAAVSAKRLPKLVLQPADLPNVFVRFDHGAMEFADLPPGPRGDERRFGRQDGWKARYKRSGSPETRGPLVVVSFADVFGSREGARKDLTAYDREFGDGPGSPVEAETVGDESVAMTQRQRAYPTAVRFYTIAWRHANVTASITVQGFEGRVSLGDALELARKQQRRIKSAA